jgi:hypothetical protein
MDKEARTELIKSIHHRCHIYMIIMASYSPLTEQILPTLLEDLFEDCQNIMDTCIIEYREFGEE